jgi:hypothetical protein
MKHKLIYNLPEERSDLNIAINGIKFYCRIVEYSDDLRRKLKYSDLPEEESKTIERMYESFNEYFNDILNDESFM